MQNETASKTALATAYMRAAHQLLDDTPLLLNDGVALHLLGPQAAAVIHGRLAFLQSPERKALRAHVVLRSRFTEDRLEEAAAGGIANYVIIGAGFDTFAFRQPSWARRLKIVEVDHPASQAAKRERLARAGLAEPGNLIFAAADFQHETLGDVLVRYGVNPDQPTFFSWLGVTMYLVEAAIDATLHSIAQFAPGSAVVLTFRQPLDEKAAELAARVSEVGEPFVSLFSPGAIEAKLRQNGFSRIDFLTREKAAMQYFSPSRTDLPVPALTSILHAVL